MTLTFELDLDSVKTNQYQVVLFKSCYPDTKTDRHTHRTDCFTWATKVVGNNIGNDNVD